MTANRCLAAAGCLALVRLPGVRRGRRRGGPGGDGEDGPRHAERGVHPAHGTAGRGVSRQRWRHRRQGEPHTLGPRKARRQISSSMARASSTNMCCPTCIDRVGLPRFGVTGEPPLAAHPVGDLRRVLAEHHPIER